MKQPRGAAGADLLFFIFFLIVLGVVWALTGGPARDISRAGPFLNPPFPLGSGTAYTVPGIGLADPGAGGSASGGEEEDAGEDTLADIIARWRIGGNTKGDSPYASQITFSRGNTASTNPVSEYLVLKTSRSLSGQLTISAWRVESVISGIGTTVGGAAYLPFSGQTNPESAIAIGADSTVYLITGRSPTGVSFRQNECSGYFAENQSFTPALKRSCPRGEDELLTAAQKGFIPNDACIDYVERFDACELVTSGFPATIGDQCQSFITTTLTYDGCVNAHKTDADFYTRVWYVYLDRDQELWKSSNEHIRLLDESGKVIATLTY